MDKEIEKLIDQIGTETWNFVDDLDGRLVLYARVEEDHYSVDIFYITEDGRLRYRFAPDSLAELVYSFWEKWRKVHGHHKWRLMAYVIDGDKFRLDLTYPSDVNPDEDISEWRPHFVEKYFGTRIVDYSMPN